VTAAVTARAHGKVNVGLSVGPLRPDGYHELVNVFHAVALADDVRAERLGRGRFAVDVTGEGAADVPRDASNLAVRAAQALAEYCGVDEGVRLHVAKRIPVAGGMAGGSADAAAALLACDALWGTGLGTAELHTLAARLGSDVPFALLGGTAIGTGRGELLSPALTSGTYHWVFALAGHGLSTPAVYAELDRLRAASAPAVAAPEVPPGLMAALRSGDPHVLAGCLVNDLQPAALSLAPSLARTLAAGRELGALAGLVSGSGPTCAFLVAGSSAAAQLAHELVAAAACRAAVPTSGPAPGAHVRWSA
jgi:4-diphosphocytidyl-2-C-methyl-D-erythritol kinase